MAAGIRAGVPTIALPAYGDGPFWARRATTLGICAATINQRALTPERLAEAMRIAVSDQQLRDRARQLGERVRAEDAAAQAVSFVNDLIQQSA